MSNKSWVTVKPLGGVVLPGQQEEIDVVVKINKTTANALVNGTEFLQEIMVFNPPPFFFRHFLLEPVFEAVVVDVAD